MEEDLIFKLLRRYAFSLKNARVAFHDFVNYVEDYVKQHIAEDPSLLIYWTNPVQRLQQDLDLLEERNRISLQGTGKDAAVIVFEYLITMITKTYEKIQNKADQPFPGIADLPKDTPPTLIEKRTAPQFIYNLLNKQEIPPGKIILLEWQNAPAIAMPSSLDQEMLLRPCLQKLKEILEQEKVFSFYTRHMSQGNPGKQNEMKAFLGQIKKDPITYFAQLQENQNTYWLWTQLCYQIKIHSVNEGIEDPPVFNLLHCALIVETFANYYKEKTEKEALKNNGLEILNTLLHRPPYYYTYAAIMKFTDEYGTPLLAFYTEDDLRSYVNDSDSILSLKVEGNLVPDRMYYIAREKVASLVKLLKNDVSKKIKSNLMKECRVCMMRFNSLEPFQKKAVFTAKVNTELRTYSPVLFALSMAFGEYNTASLFTFTGETIIEETRQELSFWYKTPPFVWFLWLYALICKKLGHFPEEEKAPPPTDDKFSDSKISDDKKNRKEQNTKKDEWRVKLRDALKRILGDMIPPDSTLLRELSLYEQQWNTSLSVSAHAQLTEDVNASIRDNLQRTIKSIKMTDFTQVRLRKMADALSSSPALMQIENKEELNMYIQLYILRILETISGGSTD